MKRTPVKEEQPANMNEFLERMGDSLAKSQRESWFQMCASALMLATMWKAKALSQMSGIPEFVIVVIGYGPFMLYTVQSWRELKERKAKIKAETLKRELEDKARSKPLLVSANPPQSGTPYPTTGHILKLLAVIMVRALWSMELLSFLLMIATFWKGEQLAKSLGIPVLIVFAVGFTPALLYTIDLLRSQRQRRLKRNAIDTR